MRITSPGLVSDLALLELQGSSVIDRGDHLVVRTPSNPTFWWGNFLLLDRSVPEAEVPEWVDRFASEFPGSRHRAFGFTGAGGDFSAWRALGYDVGTDVTMSCGAVPEASPPPEDVAIRPLVGDDDWGQSARLGASDVPEHERADRVVLEERRGRARRRLVEDGDARWFGAFAGGELLGSLGIVRLGPIARYQDVMTHVSARRRGIAGALVRAAGEWALADGAVHELVIVAEDGGPAIGLYGRLGFVEVDRHVGVELKPASS